MPGATPVYGFPYPLFGETVGPADFQALALAIDTEMLAAEALQPTLFDRPYASLFVLTPTTVPVGVETSITFATPVRDNAGMWSSGAPAQLTLPTAGVYMTTTWNMNLTLLTTNTSSRIAWYLNGVLQFAERRNENDAATNTPDLPVNGLIYAAAPGAVLTLRSLWVGTGGPARIAGNLVVRRVVA